MPYKDPNKQRQAQREYDEKRKGQRHRGWIAVSYPESEADNLRELLTNEGVPTFISPVHDRDVNGDGTPKKPHRHYLFLYDNPTSYEVAKAVADVIGAVMPPKNPKPGAPKPYAVVVRTAARYLCHLDNPEKAQYDPNDVVCVNCTLSDYFELINNAGDDLDELDKIYDFIDETGIVSYPALCRYVRQERPDWRRLVYRTFASAISRYVKGCAWEKEHPEPIEPEQRVCTCDWCNKPATGGSAGPAGIIRWCDDHAAQGRALAEEYEDLEDWERRF